jgi:hypothetical protein
MHTWLKQPATKIVLLIVVVLIGIGVVVYVVADSAGSDEARYIATATTSILAAIAALGSLCYAIVDINTRMRPLVTVYSIEQAASPGPPGQTASIPYQLEACYVTFKNTGVITAESLEIHAALCNGSCGNLLKESSSTVPVLPPNGEYILSVLTIPGPAQPLICAGTATLKVTAKYNGLGRTHETLLTYEISRNPAPIISPGFRIFVFQPTSPSKIT